MYSKMGFLISLATVYLSYLNQIAITENKRRFYYLSSNFGFAGQRSNATFIVCRN